VVLFQPHRYTRTRDLLEDFAKAFDQSDVFVLGGHLRGRGATIPGVSGAKLADIIRVAGHPSVTFVERKDQLVDSGAAPSESGISSLR